MKNMKISIIIPVYNEEKTIKDVIKNIRRLSLRKYNMSKEIIIVDDCSTDETKNILVHSKGIKLLVHKNNMGKGASIRTGLEKSDGELIIIQDADLEYNPGEIPKLIEAVLNGNDVVYGSRFLGNIVGQRIVLHEIGNKILSLLTVILYQKRITDMETGYKLFRKDVIRGMKIRSERFEFEPEITAKVLKKGYRIKEVPINFYPRTASEGKKITWRDGIRAAIALIKYRFYD
jgi:glycosyltransferase involved in cell wall biosynthesis